MPRRAADAKQAAERQLAVAEKWRSASERVAPRAAPRAARAKRGRTSPADLLLFWPWRAHSQLLGGNWAPEREGLAWMNNKQ